MKHFLSIFFLSFFLNHLSAQEKHFVFIQADNKQPFYVSVNGKLYSSTASGYVIVPKLADGTYNFTVGFAQNTFPEQTFSLGIQNKDLGFDLKNFGDKGWGLFNLQTLDVTMASTANSNVVAKALSESAAAKAPEAVISFDKKKDTTVPAAAPVDTFVASPLAKTEEVTAKSDTAVATTQPAASETVSAAASDKKTPEATAKTEKAADVKKVSEVAGDEGVHLSYVEGTGKNADTIHVIIPSSPATDAPAATQPTAAPSKSDDKASPAAGQVAASASPKNDPKFLDISVTPKKDTAAVAQAAVEPSKVMENSNCKNIATDDDYAKLRKKMAGETTDEKMIAEAKKFYRNKCFTTSQIKALSTLFLSDEGRYKFFDASFVSVADANQYYTLQSEFIDPVYANRFKALLQ